jgi:hypothetical protein
MYQSTINWTSRREGRKRRKTEGGREGRKMGRKNEGLRNRKTALSNATKSFQSVPSDVCTQQLCSALFVQICSKAGLEKSTIMARTSTTKAAGPYSMVELSDVISAIVLHVLANDLVI